MLAIRSLKVFFKLLLAGHGNQPGFGQGNLYSRGTNTRLIYVLLLFAGQVFCLNPCQIMQKYSQLTSQQSNKQASNKKHLRKWQSKCVQ